ncbi:MAG: DUF1592 domain-containing protein [Opitutaceae bacterium]
MQWALVLSVMVLLAGFFIGLLASEEILPEASWVLFLGRFHPVVLHLPIGLFVGFLIVLLVSRLSKDKASAAGCDALLMLSTLSASLAAAAGFCLATEGGYDEHLLSDHQLLGTIFTLALMAATTLRARGIRNDRTGYGFGTLGALLIAAVTMVITGHHGGSLTHGSTYLTRYAPEWLFSEGESAEAETVELISEEPGAAVEHSVMEIFEANCFKCHGPEKQKGDYRMDDMAALYAGGESGQPAIVPGQPMASYLVELITLPRDHDEAMPPEGKAELTNEEILEVIHWISEGAELAGVAPPEPVEPVAAVEVEPKEVVVEPAKVEPVAPQVFLASTDLGSDLDYITQVQPLFEEYCIRCHGPDKQKAEVRIDTLDADMLNGHDADEWKHILDVINSGEMPEADEKQPTDEERRTMVNWLTDELYEAKELKKGKVAPIIRRLNKDQYTNTLQELLGIDVEFGKNLPPEALSEEGFTNNGEVLGMSSLLVEYYILIAQEALSKAINAGEAPEVHRFKTTFGKDIRDKSGRFALGYQSASIPYKDFKTEALPIEGKPFKANAFKYGVSAPYNLAKKKQSIDDVFYVDMRGSSKNRYSLLEEGISMTAALPHVEKAASKWHGPSPNLKIVMRDFPTEGDFVMRVEASRPESLSIPANFVPYSATPAQVEYSPTSFIKAGRKSIVLDATKPFEEDRIVFEPGFARFDHANGKGPARAFYKFETSDRKALYQLDVVYAAAESRPVDITINNDEIKGVLAEKTGGWMHDDMKVQSVGLVQLDRGGHSIQFTRSNGAIPHIAYLILTPVKETPEREAALKTGGSMVPDLDESPYIRAFMGSRTDDGMEYRTFDEAKPLTGPVGERQIIEFRGRLENLPLPVIDHNDKTGLANLAVMGIWNDAFAASSRDQKNPIVVHSIEFEGPYLETWPTEYHDAIFIDSKNRNNRPVYAREIFSFFMSKAYRRRATDEEVDRIWDFWNESYQSAESFEESIKDALVIVLCSPNFLYLVEPDQEAGALGDFELASRLSYFLWNTMPDDELFYLAANGNIREELPQQVERMLKDDRAWSFIDSFTKQWLDIKSMDRVEISVDLYPKFNRFVKSDMIQETLHFVREVLVNDLSVLNFVDSDFVMLNQNLAQFYGIKGVKGSEFRRVKVDRSRQRGGLISQGSFLAGHSSGEDSHPIKRGVWLIEKILDDPPPPAPPNVPQIDQENPDLIKLSMKEQLEIHRDNNSCRDCHAQIDPWGVAFEGYDAVGLLRKKVRKQDSDGNFYEVDFDTASELQDGHQLDGVEDLKAYLAENREEDVIRSVSKHLLTYAIGRSLTFADEEAVDLIVAESRANGGNMQMLLNSVISSPLFLNR